jgi:thiol:disulfide interchange protein DsbD
LAIVVMVGAVGCGGAGTPFEPEPVAMAVTSHRESTVSWENDWEAAFERARSQAKPVMANFYADWCVWCKTLETITFRDQNVAAMLSERVVPLNLDMDRGGKGFADEHRVEAPPTIILFDADGSELGRIPGYLPPTQFMTVVEKILAGQPVTFS